jgi:hypothetical protein
MCWICSTRAYFRILAIFLGAFSVVPWSRTWTGWCLSCGEGAADGAEAGMVARQSANKRLILGMVMGSPGLTTAEIAERGGLKPTVERSTVNRLKRTGELEVLGDGVRVPLSVSPGESLLGATSALRRSGS